MNILLLGSGGREHALAWKIAASPLMRQALLRARQCRHRAGGRVRRARPRRSRRDHRVLPGEQDRFRRGWAGRPACAPASSTTWRPRASRLSGRPRPRRSLRVPRASPRICAAAHGIPTAAYERFTRRRRRPRPMRARSGAPIVVKADGLAPARASSSRENVAEAEAAIEHDVRRRLWRGRRRARDRGIPRRRRSIVLRAVRRRNGDAACLRAGPQARIRWRQGAEYRRHGRLFAGADYRRRR